MALLSHTPHSTPLKLSPFPAQVGDGGKWVCDPHLFSQKKKEEGCVVYSFGSNGEPSFELEAHLALGCEVRKAVRLFIKGAFS
jgi:hypothetical protein